MNINKDVIKNIINIDDSINNNSDINFIKSKNLLNPLEISSTINQVKNNDILYNPTPSEDYRTWSYDNCDYKIELEAGTYTFQFFTTNTASNASYFRIYYPAGNYTEFSLDSSGNGYKTITLTETTIMGIMFKLGEREGHYQIVKGSIPLTYQLYITPTINVDGENIYKKGQIIYKDKTGSAGQIDFSRKLIVGKKYKIYYYYQYGNIKSYNMMEFEFPGAINLYLDASIVVSGSQLLKEIRGTYITSSKLVSSRVLLVTYSANGCTMTQDNPGNIYITEIEEID